MPCCAIAHDEFAADEGNEILQAFFRIDRFQQHLFFLPIKWQTQPACEPDDFDDTAGKNSTSARVFGVNSGHRTVTRWTANDKRSLDLGTKGVYSSLYFGSFVIISRSGFRLLVAALFFKYLDQYLTLLSILGSFRAGRNKRLASDISVIYQDSSSSNQHLSEAGLPPIVQAECR